MGQKNCKQLESILKYVELNKTENRAKQILSGLTENEVETSFCFKIQRSGKSKAFTLKKKKKEKKYTVDEL